MSLWVFLEALLMLTNAIAILNEDRFLVPREYLPPYSPSLPSNL
jgi:hypothetical protein